MGGNTTEKLIDFRPPNKRPGRVIRVCNEDDTRFISHGIRHGFQIVCVVFKRYLNGDRVHLEGIEAVHGERRIALNNLVTRLEKCLGQQVQDFIAAVAEHQGLLRHLHRLGDGAAQGRSTSLRIQCNSRCGLEQCGEGMRGWAQRIFVRSKLDDICQAQLTLHLLDRFSRHIRTQAGNVIGDCHGGCLCLKHRLFPLAISVAQNLMKT